MKVIMMKTAHAYPLPQWHVRILLQRTCLNHPSGTGSFTIYPPKSITPLYKCKTRGASCQSQTRYSHSRSHTPTTKIKIKIKICTTEMAEQGGDDCDKRKKLRSEFLQVLSSRRTPQVPLSVEIAKPVLNSPPPSGEELEVMESCPKVEIKEGVLKEENLYLNIEEGEQGRLPLLILSLKQQSDQELIKRPAVVFLHSTGKYKEYLRPLIEAYASRGYVAISADSRYHGERASSTTSYRDGLIDAWKNGKTMPFIYDTVWDMIKLADYLNLREDIDPSRIGITGISLGGMHAWFAAFADTRYAVVAPKIGVQGFRWAIDNDKWQARVDSIKPVFEVARDDLGKSAIDKEVVEKVWDRIAPGLASQFDSPYSIPCIAPRPLLILNTSRFDSPYSIPAIVPRPLLILNGAEDPRCHLGGLEVPESNTLQAYKELDSLDHFKFIAEPEVGHLCTRFHVKEAAAWFDRFLKP